MRPFRLTRSRAVLCAFFFLIGSSLIVQAAGPSGGGGGHGGGGGGSHGGGGGGGFHGGTAGGGFHGSLSGNGPSGAFGGGSFRPPAPQPLEPQAGKPPQPKPHPHPGPPPGPHPGPPPGPHPGPRPGPYYHGWVFFNGGWVPYYDESGEEMAAALAVGTFLEALAADVQTLVIGNETYYFDGVNYYQACYQGIDSGYCVVPNPYGDNE